MLLVVYTYLVLYSIGWLMPSTSEVISYAWFFSPAVSQLRTVLLCVKRSHTRIWNTCWLVECSDGGKLWKKFKNGTDSVDMLNHDLFFGGFQTHSTEVDKFNRFWELSTDLTLVHLLPSPSRSVVAIVNSIPDKREDCFVLGTWSRNRDRRLG